jgi:hypothetical protein
MEQRSILIFSILLLSAVEYSYEQQQQNCIPLKQCSSLMLLFQNRDNLPNLNRVDVYRHLQRVYCGFRGIHYLVDCPDIEGKILLLGKIPILNFYDLFSVVLTFFLFGHLLQSQ